jgi:hypothetical protein
MDVQNAAIVIAVVQAVKSVFPARVSGVVTIVVAGAVGAALAFVNKGDVVTGIFEGLVGAGVITTASRIGK